ncbi:MAG TPA: helix-turn-helix transcriptional regulator [Actinophytocola sp.]|jgi:AraC-like DNA-binding protein|uniref:AraC family transcriptional regulator n=1 Tax=Actinophytocola sp. TaxID=1872138 RepID=UPI002E0095B3|nr:helix-turn-helix transcriptional regulator [Actinophytocola sp.]
MSQNGHGGIVIATARLPGGVAFDWHEHPVHQLAWADTGVLTVATARGTWVLPPSRALWIPAGVPHALGSSGRAVTRSPYFRPRTCPVEWTSPTVIRVSDLLGHLIVHLASAELTEAARRNAEAVVVDLLEPLDATTITVPQPADDRARRVAEALRRDPSDARGLEAWGREVGASSRTLARIFLTQTGMTFGRWRAQLRLEAALPLLAADTPVTAAAHRVGYTSASAFVAAFRRAVGVPPGRYFG